MKPNVRARAPVRENSPSGILKPKLFKAPQAKALGGGAKSKQQHLGDPIPYARKLQQLQDELRLLRISVVQQAHAIRLLQQGRNHPTIVPNTDPFDLHHYSPVASNSRAERALVDLEARLGVTSDSGAEQATQLKEVSERVKAEWIQDGLLVGSVAFGLSWARTRQALEQACDRGELFNLKIGNKRWYPASLMGLSPEDVKPVCLLLRGVDPVSQFIFWERKHGFLSGQTLSQALHAGNTAAVLRAAEVFASEHAPHAAIA